MIQKCTYDEVRDLKRVDQFGWIDLAAANALGSVPANISNTELQYNGIEDPRSIAGRASDQFELAQANKAIAGYKAPEKTQETE